MATRSSLNLEVYAVRSCSPCHLGGHSRGDKFCVSSSSLDAEGQCPAGEEEAGTLAGGVGQFSPQQVTGAGWGRRVLGGACAGEGKEG